MNRAPAGPISKISIDFGLQWPVFAQTTADQIVLTMMRKWLVLDSATLKYPANCQCQILFRPNESSTKHEGTLPISPKVDCIHFASKLIVEKRKTGKMLLKPRTRNKLFDRLHHGVASLLIGVTILASLDLCYFGYIYYTQGKPQRKMEQLKLLNEGAHDRDTAETLSP